MDVPLGERETGGGGGKEVTLSVIKAQLRNYREKWGIRGRTAVGLN